MATDFEELFDDIMYYARKKLPRDEIRTKEDLRDYITDIDPEGRITPPTLKEILSTNAATRYVGGTLRDKALSEEARRSPRARLADEAVTAKDTRPVNKASYDAWRRNPDRFDLSGVDTATRRAIHNRIRTKATIALKAGYQVRRRGTQYYRIEKQGRLRDLITGRYIKKR